MKERTLSAFGSTTHAVALGVGIVVLAGLGGGLAARVLNPATVPASPLSAELAVRPPAALQLKSPPPAPTLAQSKPQKPVSSAALRQASEEMWEVSLTSGALPAPPILAAVAPAWRFEGVFETEAGPALIVVTEGAATPRYLRVGDRLPNNAAILAIARDAVTVRTLINKRPTVVVLAV